MSNEAFERYFDHAGSCPPFPESLKAQEEAALRWFANPSASHGPGRSARGELNRLKEAFSALCGFADGRLVLTSGATEANNLVIHGVMSMHRRGRLLAAVDAHASLWESCQRFRDRLDVLPLDGQGRIPPAVVAKSLKPDTRLLCISHAASETGVVHEVGAIAALCERRGVRCHVDGVQALGHLPVDLSGIPCDFYAFSAHKFGGPRGVGGVLSRTGEISPLLAGGPQEWGIRPGTENLAGFAGALEALRRSIELIPAETERLRGWSRFVIEEIRRSGIPFLVNGSPDDGLPGLVSLSFPGLNGHALVTELSLNGYAVASGSACHADKVEPSRVILAFGRRPEEALGTIRISFGRHSGQEAVRSFAAVLADVVRRQTSLK